MASARKMRAAVLVLAVTLLPQVLGKTMVRLTGVAGSTSTSSTLAWVAPPRDGTLPEYAVHVGQEEEEGGGLEGGPVWCRGKWHNVWIPGELGLDRKCAIAFLGTVYRVDDFDLLVSLGGAARVAWVTWDKHMAKPDKSVMSPDQLVVMVYDSFNGTIHTGNLGVSRSYRTATLFDKINNISYESSKVMVLVEVEPTRYTLADIQLDTVMDSTKYSSVILGNKSLVNNHGRDLTIAEDVDYVIKEKQYFGRVQGTVTALPAVVYPPDNADPLEVNWGLDIELDKVGYAHLKADLPNGVGVNASIIGKLRHYEAPYFGTIRAYYEDGQSRTWRINSYHSHDIIVTVIAQYSSPFYLHNLTVLPGIEATSRLLYELTTTTSSTTSTTTTTTTTTTPLPTTTSTTTPQPPVSSTVASDEESSMESSPKIGSLSRDPTYKPSHLGSFEDTQDSNPPYHIEPLKTSGAEQMSASQRVSSAIASVLASLLFKYYYYGSE